MKKPSLGTLFRSLPCLLFLTIIGSLFLRNGALFLNYSKANLPAGYKSYTQSVETYLSENLAGKYHYIDLNGTVNKLLGINILNKRVRLENGHMADFTNFTDVEASADNVKSLSDFLTQENIGFLYAYIPGKIHSFDAELPPGYDRDHQHDQVDALASALTARGINHIDLDAWFQENGWTMEDIYFRTDHHWTPEAAFAATDLVMERLSQNGSLLYDQESLDPKNWIFETYENWFLGSDGRKTGKAFAGVDDITFIYPSYGVDSYVGRVNPDRTMPELDTGSVYRPAGLEGETIYQRDPYGIYLGNNYPYAYIQNSLAQNDQKLLIIGDSYRLTMECFLTTQFSEIIHVDMREYKDGSFLSLVKQIDPDQVLLMCCIPEFDGVQNFGLAEWEEHFGGKTLGNPWLTVQALQVEAGENPFTVVEDLPAGAYQLTLGNASLGGSHQELTQFALIDTVSGEVLSARYFLTNYGEVQAWLFTVPEGTDCAIAAYHGMPGNGEENTLQLQDISLQPYE